MRTILLGLASVLVLVGYTGAIQAVEFSSDTLIDTGDGRYRDQHIVVNGCTLTLNGEHQFRSLQVINGGVVTHSPASLLDVDHKILLTILEDATISADSTVSADEMGYGPEIGPGKGHRCYHLGSGGGYGGLGGVVAGCAGGLAYGAPLWPMGPGSGGGNAMDAGSILAYGGVGGGSIGLQVYGTLTVNGRLMADGQNGGQSSNASAGGGSGGRIWIYARVLTGTGVISAQGGNSLTSQDSQYQGGGGGGGRIDIDCTEDSFTGARLVDGGFGATKGWQGTITEPYWDRLKAVAEARLAVWRDFYDRENESGFLNSIWWSNRAQALLGSMVDLAGLHADQVFSALLKAAPRSFTIIAAGGGLVEGLLLGFQCFQFAEFQQLSLCLAEGCTSTDIPEKIEKMQVEIQNEMNACTGRLHNDYVTARSNQRIILDDLLGEPTDNIIRDFAWDSGYSAIQFRPRLFATHLYISWIVRSLYSLARSDLTYLMDGTAVDVLEVHNEYDDPPSWQIMSIAPGTHYDERVFYRGSLYAAFIQGDKTHIWEMKRMFPWQSDWLAKGITDGTFHYQADVRLAVGNIEGGQSSKLYAVVQQPDSTLKVFSYDMDYDWGEIKYVQHRTEVLSAISGSLSSTCQQMLLGDPSNNSLNALYFPTRSNAIREVFYRPVLFVPTWHAPKLPSLPDPGGDDIGGLAIGDGNPADGSKANELFVGTQNGYVYMYTAHFAGWNSPACLNSGTPLGHVVSVSVDCSGKHQDPHLQGVFVLTLTHLWRLVWQSSGTWDAMLLSDRINAGKSVVVTNGFVFISSNDGLSLFEPGHYGGWSSRQVTSTSYAQLVTKPASIKKSDGAMVNMDPAFIDGFYGFTDEGRIDNIKLKPCGGSLQVIIGPPEAIDAGAKWKLTTEEEGTWHKSGEMLEDLPVGTAVVEYESVLRWTKPSNDRVVLRPRETTIVSATYDRDRGSLQVTITPQSAIDAGAAWKLTTETNWHPSEHTLTGIPSGQVEVEYQPIPIAGWSEPANEIVEIKKDETAFLVGTYTAHVGHLTVTITPEAAIQAGARWKLNTDTIWHRSGSTVIYAVGTYTLEFMSIDGWNKPGNKQVTIDEEDPKEETSNYSRLSCGQGPPGDLYHDCRIDFADVAILAGHWQNSCQPDTGCKGADGNRDGEVTFVDLHFLLIHWLECTGSGCI